jgi:ribonuclease VapC
VSLVVVDTSAILAILFGEPEREGFLNLLEENVGVISAGSAIELSRVVMRREPQRLGRERALLAALGVTLASVDEAQVALAMEGQVRFGTGRRAPPAVLNFGDLFAYALARHLDAPLLFKGDDFRRTDVKVAL